LLLLLLQKAWQFSTVIAVLLLYEAPERARGVVSLAHPRYAQPFVTAPAVGVTVCAVEVVVPELEVTF
jgi:hypothetical protein